MTRTIAALGLLALVACADDDAENTEETGSTSGSGTTSSSSAGTTADSAGETEDFTGVTGDTTGSVPDGPWQPGTVLPSEGGATPRGFVDLRGLIHTHSPYSHDACDGEPRDDAGVLDAMCMEDWRRGMCQTQHDYLFLTDHRDSFSGSEYPEVLHYIETSGDELIERDGSPVANRAMCDDGARVVVMAGTEAASMPVGLERHVPGRGDTYGEFTADAMLEFKDHGAVVLLQHTEDWEVAELTDMPIDGFEMYNLHANLFLNIAAGAELVTLLQTQDPGLPHSDLVVFPIFAEDPAYLERWGSVLASGARRVTTMGTDAHRNSFPQLLPDGERIDSFRRMMQWFSNHLLVRPSDDGTWDDAQVKDALREGRLYGAFEYMGYPSGFDAYAETSEQTVEIGSEIPLGQGPELVATAPTVRELDPDAEAPLISLHLMRAIDGGFEQVAEGTDELRYMPDEAGAYRFEVRISPRHIREFLGKYADDADTPRVWIYANPIYVRE